jgi:phosphoribosylpyrophosphate synthetase
MRLSVRAPKVTAVVPYLAYARQDKMFLAGEGISVETISKDAESRGRRRVSNS